MTRRRLAAVLAVAVAVAGCSDEPSEEAFCAAAEATVAAGPLFPDRTDGEPVPEPAALAALEDLADASPDEVADDVAVLLAEARALVAAAEARQGGTATTGTTGADADRPDREAVDAAQVAVVGHVSATCEIDLNP